MTTSSSGRMSPITEFMVSAGIPEQFNPSIRGFVNHERSILQADINSWRSIAEASESRIDELDSQIKTANQTIQSLQKALSEAKKSSASLEEEKEQLLNQIDQLHQSPKTDSRASSELNEALSALKTLEQDLASSNDEIKVLKGNLTQTTKKFEQLQKEYDQVSSLPSTVQDLTDEITTLRREANTSSRTIEDLEQQVRDLEDEKGFSQKDSGTVAETTLSAELHQISSQEEEMKSLKAANEALRKEKADLTNQLSEAKKSAGNMTKAAIGCAVIIASMAIAFFR